MEHHGSAHSRSQIGRAGGQKSEMRIEGIRNPAGEGVVELVDPVPDRFQLKAGTQGLNAEMVLLVDHGREGFIPVRDQTGCLIRIQHFAADQTPFQKKLLPFATFSKSTQKAPGWSRYANG